MIQEGNDIAEKRSLLEKIGSIYFWKKKIKNRNIQVVHVVHRHYFGQEKKKQEKDEKEDQLCLDRKNDTDGIRTRERWILKGYLQMSTALTTRPLSLVSRVQILTIYTYLLSCPI